MVLCLSNASIRNFEIFFITDGDLEFMNKANLCSGSREEVEKPKMFMLTTTTTTITTTTTTTDTA